MQRPATRRAEDGLLIASGAALVLVVLLVLQSLVGSGLLSTKTVTLTTSDPYEQVATAFASHLTRLRAGNISAVVSGYESNATVEWTGAAAGLTGNYSGTANIEILLGSFTGKLLNFSLSNEYQSVGVKGNVPVVNSTFNFQGYSTIVGEVNGTVLARIRMSTTATHG